MQGRRGLNVRRNRKDLTRARAVAIGMAVHGHTFGGSLVGEGPPVIR